MLRFCDEAQPAAGIMEIPGVPAAGRADGIGPQPGVKQYVSRHDKGVPSFLLCCGRMWIANRRKIGIIGGSAISNNGRRDPARPRRDRLS